MRWIVGTFVMLVAVIGVIAIVGYFLPVAHEASRSVELNRPPDQVFALIENPQTYQAWWEDADVQTEVIERVPPSKLVTKIVGETQFGGTWTFEVVPTSSGSRLTITERGEIYNVVFRTLTRFVFGYTGTMESFLAAAGAKLN